MTFDAVVLAGGTGRRLGGASKPDVLLAGRRLLDHALAATAGAGRVVVVAPEDVQVPPGVVRTLEDPPLGGPVAGVSAGLTALDAAPGPSAPLLLVLACDVPRAASAVPRLLRAAIEARGDGAALTDAGGRPQWLTAVYRTAALRARLRALPPAGASVRELVSGLDLAAVAAADEEAADVDTWQDLAALEEG
ncbi:molybdenum cofactor guanylyltransferase [Georgenia daeguensis]|uniref:MobA-like NTP transferase domain-containing protein n=1 Tax=Georgenia daeguensis TaxID=908355 RepID=A0ABP8EX62_9MICO